MNRKIFARGLKRRALTVALGMCFVGAIHAQSSITGTIFGQVPAQAGNTVVVENLDTGLKRTVTVDNSGRYQASSLPNGRYKVTLQKDGAVVSVRDNIAVNISGGSEVSFAAVGADGTTQLDSVVVRGGIVPVIDVSQTDTRTVFTAEQLSKISIARDVASVALLAPSVVRSDSYSGVPSFGGSAASENAYFINGYPVTNPLTTIGFTTLPFDAIGEQQVLTGGYGAEFGRSTGGVINLVTKRGTNEWKGGVYAMWTPEFARAAPRDSYYPDTGFFPADAAGQPANRRTDGTLNTYRDENLSWSMVTGAYVGGPIVKDRLFIYADAELSSTDGTQVRSSRLDAPGSTLQRTGWDEYSNDFPRWAAKVDWNITDDHLLEFTGISDETKTDSKRYGFSYDTFKSDGVQGGGTTTHDDAKLYIGKYTGYLTDDLTLTALYGEQSIKHNNSLPFKYNPSCPLVTAATAARAPSIPSANYNGCQVSTSTALTATQPEESTKSWRLDVAYRIGDHDLRIGYERQDSEVSVHTRIAGGLGWTYSRMQAPNDPNTPINSGSGVGSPASGGGLGSDGYYVARVLRQADSDPSVEQEAQYIEDRWQVTNNLLLSLGLRNEQFTNFDGRGNAYISQRNQLAPRMGFSWDIRGDATLKLFGNVGRYHLALPNNAAIRGASASLNTLEYFTYTGVDPVTGAPTGLNPIPVDTTKNGICPGTNQISANRECGDAPDPRTTTAKDLKSHYQDEYIIGFEHAFSPSLSWGAKFTYRDLKSAIDDICGPLLNDRCLNANPGLTNTFFIRQPDGTFIERTVTAEDMHMPKLKRKYYALDLFAEHPFADNWYGKIEYTFSRNWGNTEGQLASDLDTGAGGQADVSRTQDWDLYQLMVGSNGLLPNHRAHQLKAFGYYQVNPEWRTGATLVMASGRPRNCTSHYPTADSGLYSGAAYWFCGLSGSGLETGAAPAADYRISPRGSYGETPLTFQLNLNVSYEPAWAEGLTLQADVINVLNRQVAGSYNSRYETGTRNEPNPVFQQQLNISTPRYLRLTARYDF